MIKDYLRFGVGNILHKGIRSWLTMIGIFIGIALVVALLSLGQGMKDAVAAQFTSIGAETITVSAAGGGFGPPGSYQAAMIGTEDLKVVQRVRGIEAAFGRLIESVTVKVDREKDFGYIVTLPSDPREYEYAIEIPNDFKVSSGRLIAPQDGCKLMIGHDLSTKDRLVRKLRLRDKVMVENKAFDVVGILEKTGNPQLDATLFAPEDCVREILEEDEKYGLIAAKIEKNENVDLVIERVEKALRKSRGVELGREDFNVESSQEVLDTINTILNVVQYVLLGIAVISLIVGGIGIMNTMYTSVLERTKEIGIMKAIGARNGDILNIFLVESGLLGLVGGLVGIAIGLGLAYGLSYAATQFWGTNLIEAHASFILIFGSAAFAFVVGTISGVFPALQASKQNPVEALRYE